MFGRFAAARPNTIGTTGIPPPTESAVMSADTDGETRTLDARTIDGEPFGDVVAALDELADGEALVLVNGFEPEPLYGVLERRGFDYETTRAAADEWRVTIARA
jgi:uncharacterized protein (DUF2249 family)